LFEYGYKEYYYNGKVETFYYKPDSRIARKDHDAIHYLDEDQLSKLLSERENSK